MKALKLSETAFAIVPDERLRASLDAMHRKIDNAFHSSIEKTLADDAVRSKIIGKVWLTDPVGWSFIREDGSEVFRVTIVYDMEAMTATVVNTLAAKP